MPNFTIHVPCFLLLRIYETLPSYESFLSSCVCTICSLTFHSPAPTQLLSEGEEKVNWLSPQFPDFLAKIKTAICTDLCSSLSALHAFSSSLSQVTSSWSQVSRLDIFARDGENTPEGLSNKHWWVQH